MIKHSTTQPQGRGTSTALSRFAALLMVGFAALAPAQTTTVPTTTQPTTTTPRPSNPTNNFNNNMNRSGTNSRTNPNQNRSNTANSRNSRSSREKERDSTRKKKDRSKSKTTDKTNSSTSGRATLQGQSAIAAQTRAKNAKAGGANAKGPAQKTALPLPVLQINPLITQTTLYFSPAQDRHPADSRFTTRLFLYNADTTPVDRLDIWLHYPPDLVEPREVDFSPIRSQILGEPVREVLREGGYVHLALRFSTPANQLIQPLININWEGLGIAAPATLMIESPNGEPLGIFAGSKNLLESSLVGNEGLVAGEVTLYDENGHSEVDDAPFRETAAGVDPLLPDAKGAGVRLGLVPKDEELVPGEVSTMDVVLLNPQVANVDEVRFRLRFEPGAVEILDADENNFITSGVNIYDGGFHEGMPFDTHTRNEVNPIAGTIDYVAGMSGTPRGVSSGTIARVVFRMKRDAGAATFWFEGLDPLTGRMISDVRARGRSLLGSEEVRPSEALHNAQIAVAPIK